MMQARAVIMHHPGIVRLVCVRSTNSINVPNHHLSLKCPSYWLRLGLMNSPRCSELSHFA